MWLFVLSVNSEFSLNCKNCIKIDVDVIKVLKLVYTFSSVVYIFMLHYIVCSKR